MSMEDEISIVENAKKSDGTSTAGEHDVEKVSDEQSAIEGEDQMKKESTTDDIEKKEDGSVDTTNKKAKIIEPSIDQTNPEELTVV